MNLISVSFGAASPTTASTFVWSVGTAVAAGVVLFFLNWGRELLTAHWKRTSEASVLAFTISSQLDEFVSQCSDVVANGYDFDPETGEVKDTAKRTTLSFSSDLLWYVLDKKLQHQIRSLPNEVDVANRTLEASWREEDTELLDVLQEREELYAQIGLRAMNLNKVLSDRYSVPLLNRRNWHPEKVFRSSLESFAKHRAIVESLSNRHDVSDLLPAASDEELRRRSSALSADLKAAMDRKQGAASD